jgi:hypothetical protein
MSRESHDDSGERSRSGDPPRAAHLPPGYDEEDPYEDADLETYPDWWRENVELFREHGLRPYRPPRFADGTLTTPLVEALASDLGVEVELRTVNPQRTATTEVLVDGERIATVQRSRESDGHTEYDLAAGEFEAAVRSAARSGGPERADPTGPADVDPSQDG